MDDPGRTRGGLPAELTRFIGREAELADIKAALAAVRLVTLIGVGGVGKTRVVLRAARASQADHPDGIYFVALSALHDPGLLANAVSAVLDLPERSDQPGGTQLNALISYLSGKRLLLVLDTCEHLIDACAQFVQTVLLECPDVRIIATSRQPLDAPGERLLQILPLPAPDPDEEPGVPAEPNDAMVLFAERATAVVPGFRLTADNWIEVARLCHRLDGIPLAIELAVVRLRALPLSGLLERLDDRYRLLTGGSRAAVPRHQTLRTAIDWSHQLCSPQEQLLWARLSVFAGEFELAAAEEICSGGDLPVTELLENLIGLVDKAIVLRVDDAAGARYRMLDTIREYGLEQLRAFGEEHTYRARHRDHYLALAGRFSAQWLSREQMPWLRRLSPELSSLRSALEFCCTSEAEATAGLDMATALWGLWLCMGRTVEGQYWLDRLLPACPEPGVLRMRGLYVGGHLYLMSGQHERGTELTEQAAALAQEYGDPAAVATIAYIRGLKYAFTNDLGPALEQLSDARRRFSELGDLGGEAWVQTTICGALAVSGKYDETLIAGREESVLLAALGDRWLQGWYAWIHGLALWGLGRYDEAVTSLRTALTMCYEINHLHVLAFAFDTLGWIACAQQQYDIAARHLGTATKVWEKFNVPRMNIATMHQAHEDAAAAARGRLGNSRYRTQYDKGAALPLRQAVALATDIASDGRRSAATGQLAGWAVLTRREQEVALLVAEGLSNRQIAERLVVSKRTVDSHIEHILGKLSYSSRTQIAGLAAAQGPVIPAT